MHITVKNLLNINEKVKVKFNSNKNLLKQPEIIAVSKTFKMDRASGQEVMTLEGTVNKTTISLFILRKVNFLII